MIGRLKGILVHKQPPWLVVDDADPTAADAGDHALVGSADPTDRTAHLDRARAFASVAPVD